MGSFECQVGESELYAGSKGEPRWISEQEIHTQRWDIGSLKWSRRVERENQEMTAVSGEG